ncbi:MAG: hypothetical protein NVV62_08040 [Terricaulis sp.]|nr:hypothetical protein [Terricaulis sp.]
MIESTADSVHGVMRKIKLKRAGAVELSGFVRAAGRNAIAIWAGEDGSGVNFDLAAARLSQMLPQGRHRILEAEMLRSAGEWGQWRQFRVVIWAEAPGAMRLHINLLSEPHAGSRHQGDGTSGVDLWGLHAFYPQTQRQSVRDAV